MSRRVLEGSGLFLLYINYQRRKLSQCMSVLVVVDVIRRTICVSKPLSKINITIPLFLDNVRIPFIIASLVLSFT